MKTFPNKYSAHFHAFLQQYNPTDVQKTTQECTKYTFETGFIVNVFDKKTEPLVSVNYQGKPDENLEKIFDDEIKRLNSLA